MDIYYKKLTALLVVSAILLNPVFSSTTSPPVTTNSSETTNSTTLGTTIDNNETTESTITTSTTTPTTVASTTATTTTTTIVTTVPTTEPPTTEPPTPVNIGESCNQTNQCRAVDQNTECSNGFCKCMDNYFMWNETVCANVSYLIPSSLSLHSNETSVSVAWTGPSGLPSLYHIVYHVKIKGDNINNDKTTTETETQFGGLTAGKMYTITLYSVLNNTIMSDSINGSQFTRPNAPDCPPNRSNYSAPNITVTWSIPTGEVTGYIISFNNNDPLDITSTSQMFYSTEPGVNYTMTLQTYVDHNGKRYNSSVENCYIRTESAEPDPPQNVTVSGAPKQDSFNVSVIKTDTPRGDIVAYIFHVYNKSYIEDEYTYLKDVEESVTENDVYTLSMLSAGNYHFIQVFTKNEKFTSGSSFNVTDIKTAEGFPGGVSKLNFTSTRDSVNVTWMRPQTPRGDIIGYKLALTVQGFCKEYIQEISVNKIDKNCSDVIRSIVSKNEKKLEQFIDKLQPSVEYGISVWAYTEVGIGEEQHITVSTNLAPPLKPTIGTPFVKSATSVTVTWDKPSERTGPTTYTVAAYDEIKNAKINDACVASDFNTTQCTVRGLEEFWQYSFEVTATVGTWSNTSERSSVVTTDQGEPAKVNDFNVILTNSGCKTHLSWTTPDRQNRNGLIQGYLIEYGGTNLFVEDPNPQPYKIENTEFTKEIELAEGNRYRISVRAQLNISRNGKEATSSVNTVNCYQPLTGGEIVGIVICVLLLIVIIGIVGYFVYRKWDSLRAMLPIKSPEEEVELLTPMRHIDRNRPIVVSTIKDFLLKYHSDSNRLFLAEYDDLKTISPRHPCNDANKDENKPKNRYTNILSFDHSRVILAPTEEEDSSDYINANYIPGYTYGKEYIASQGPLPGTTNDFWRMIWEQQVSVIVMLTKCSENNMDKCEHYWPYQANEPKCYNDLMVNVTSISNMGKYDIHIMDLCLGDEKRVIRHFHFLEWPDFSAKVETTTLIDFISTVRLQITPDIKGPTLVHCSAGVGRTGTYITVDYLMQFVRDNDLSSQVDIFDWVYQMREYRVSMVQTPTQYAFIHDCLADIVERKQKSLQRNSEATNGDIAIDNPAFEPDDLYENTKIGIEQPKTEL